jgi:hypothetical protein
MRQHTEIAKQKIIGVRGTATTVYTLVCEYPKGLSTIIISNSRSIRSVYTETNIIICIMCRGKRDNNIIYRNNDLRIFSSVNP